MKDLISKPPKPFNWEKELQEWNDFITKKTNGKKTIKTDNR